jgi:hypothetical protein
MTPAEERDIIRAMPTGSVTGHFDCEGCDRRRPPTRLALRPACAARLPPRNIDPGNPWRRLCLTCEPLTPEEKDQVQHRPFKSAMAPGIGNIAAYQDQVRYNEERGG